MATEEVPSSVNINGKEYKPLADGNYDVIVLGTGLKECILGGLMAVEGKKVRTKTSPSILFVSFPLCCTGL